MTDDFQDDDLQDEDTMVETWATPVRFFQSLYNDDLSQTAVKDAFAGDSKLVAIEFDALKAGEDFKFGGMTKCYTKGKADVEFTPYHMLASDQRAKVAHLTAVLNGDVWFLRRLALQVGRMNWPTPSTVDAEDMNADITVLLFADFVQVLVRSAESIFTAVKISGEDHFEPELYAFAMVEAGGSNHAALRRATSIRRDIQSMRAHLQIDLDEDWIWDMMPPEIDQLRCSAASDEVDMAFEHKDPKTRSRTLAP